MLRVSLFVLLLLGPRIQAQPAMVPGPRSPEESLHCIRVRPGFKVELMAAEPLVQDPIAFAWGPDGKFWVVEMGDYPLGVDGKNKPGGRVKFLEDTDGDGPYDKATLFLDDLGYPDRRAALAEGRARHLRPGHLLRRGHRRRRQGGQEGGPLTPASAKATSSTASTASSGASTTGSTAPTATPAARVKSLKTGQDRRHQRPRFPHQARRRRDRGRDRPDAVRPVPRRLGQLVRLQQQQPDVPLRARRPLPAPQPARALPPTRRCRCRCAGRAGLSDQQDPAALQ